MDSGLYAAYTALLARSQALELGANNIANAGTTGFRAQREAFRSVLAQTATTPDSQVGLAANNFGVLGGAHLSTAEGTIAATGNPLDLALSGAGFFSVKTANGIRYTRDGEFTRSDAGLLTNTQGAPVLDATGNPIVVPTGTLAVGADGSIVASSAQGSAIVGRVGVFDLGANAQSAEGSNLYKAADGTVPVTSTATVRAGALEGSNEDAVQGTVQLLVVQRQAEMMQRALSVFHNDFDKTATEELPRA